MEDTLKLILDKLNNMDSDIKDLKSDTKNLQSDMKDLKDEVKTIGNQLTKIENDHGSKLDSLLDGYKQLYGGQQEIKDDIQNLYQQQENQDIKIKAINSKIKAI